MQSKGGGSNGYQASRARLHTSNCVPGRSWARKVSRLRCIVALRRFSSHLRILSVLSLLICCAAVAAAAADTGWWLDEFLFPPISHFPSSKGTTYFGLLCVCSSFFSSTPSVHSSSLGFPHRLINLPTPTLKAQTDKNLSLFDTFLLSFERLTNSRFLLRYAF